MAWKVDPSLFNLKRIVCKKESQKIFIQMLICFDSVAVTYRI